MTRICGRRIGYIVIGSHSNKDEPPAAHFVFAASLKSLSASAKSGYQPQ